MIVNGFLLVTSTHSEKWIKLADVLYYETPGSEGKPAGWIDEAAAVAFLATGQSVILRTDEWREAKSDLGFPRTDALGAPRDWPARLWKRI